jgi:hypothetical protein
MKSFWSKNFDLKQSRIIHLHKEVKKIHTVVKKHSKETKIP